MAHEEPNHTEAPRKGKAKKRVEDDEGEKKKFPTSEDVYKRILWDDRFDANLFEIGYEDRFRGLMYMPLRNFRGTGDETSEVPFHRVQLIRSGGVLVWDRATRLYKLDEWGTNPTRSQAPVAQASAPEARDGTDPRTIPLRSGYWNGTEWEAGERPAPPPQTTIKLLTFNMLFSDFEPTVFCPSARMSLFLQELEREDADIVALQEVTPDAWQMIENSPFVRSTYNICDVNGACVCPTGQGILSKFPFYCSWILPFGPVKRAVFGRLTTPIGQLFVSNVHLSSDFSRDNSETRVRELSKIYSSVKEEENVIIMGDFNFGDEAPENEKIKWGNYKDVWKCANVGDDIDGFTFDISANWMAERNAKNHRYPRRLDRILIRSPYVNATNAAICMKSTELYRAGAKEIDIYPSDHFGVSCLCDLSPAATSQANNVTSEPYEVDVSQIARNLPLYCRSTVCLLATPDTWECINGIRRQFDPVYARWPPHINLLYPFATESEFEVLAPLLHRAVKDIEPFTIKLTDLETFGGRSKYIYADPDRASAAHVSALHESLVKALPMCRSGKEFSPHLTVAQFNAQEPAQRDMGKAKLLQLLRTRFDSVEFKVTHIHMMARDGNDSPFRVAHSIPLGSPTSPEFPSPWDAFPGWPPLPA